MTNKKIKLYGGFGLVIEVGYAVMSDESVSIDTAYQLDGHGEPTGHQLDMREMDLDLVREAIKVKETGLDYGLQYDQSNQGCN